MSGPPLVIDLSSVVPVSTGLACGGTFGAKVRACVRQDIDQQTTEGGALLGTSFFLVLSAQASFHISFAIPITSPFSQSLRLSTILSIFDSFLPSSNHRAPNRTILIANFKACIDAAGYLDDLPLETPFEQHTLALAQSRHLLCRTRTLLSQSLLVSHGTQFCASAQWARNH
ncbi:hypothetical protein VFPPC_16930 [Pochonia chlamydosporia 170]|uniref:Uncharacterized protein n=1 Tax=Pochonia chlamydosporia 170 TaxID=1380566 RepID=A0A179F055_METCM|nr:hypothetical protein VFPPC_16930 [Pochonia chlamydosporia 170]OAQ58835.1 hypothetical protein VFPPC_16930 [Pochonia chlamydosporia 170]